MQTFLVLVHGENLLTELDGTAQRVGFYKHVAVEAFTPADAESRALDTIREDSRFQGFVQNSDDDPFRLSAEEVQEREGLDPGVENRKGYILYPEVPAHALQLGLNFAAKPPELFAGKEMGEDALRVLNDIIPLQAAIRADITAELPHLRKAAKWASRLTSAANAATH